MRTFGRSQANSVQTAVIKLLVFSTPKMDRQSLGIWPEIVEILQKGFHKSDASRRFPRLTRQTPLSHPVVNHEAYASR